MEIKEIVKNLEFALADKAQQLEIATKNFKEACDYRKTNIDSISKEMSEMNAAFAEMCTLTEDLKPLAAFIIDNLAFARKLQRKTTSRSHENI